jgi:aminoglycoside phosphotransferase (APT) family kinase protein
VLKQRASPIFAELRGGVVRDGVMTNQKATELAWVAESLEDLAIVLRELHGLDEIADQLDLARERLERCPTPTSRWKEINSAANAVLMYAKRSRA